MTGLSFVHISFRQSRRFTLEARQRLSAQTKFCMTQWHACIQSYLLTAGMPTKDNTPSFTVSQYARVQYGVFDKYSVRPE